MPDITVYPDFISKEDQTLLADFIASSAFPYRFQNVHNESAEVAQKRLLSLSLSLSLGLDDDAHHEDSHHEFKTDISRIEELSELAGLGGANGLMGLYASSKQLTHHLFMAGEEGQSPHYPILTPILNSIQDIHGDILLYRAKVNVNMPDGYRDPVIVPGSNSPRYVSQVPHTDLKFENGNSIPHLVCLYYVNDSDGPTFFYDNDLNVVKKVSPSKGTAVIFDGDTLHAGSNPILTPLRFAININFLPSNESDYDE
jgi:hypothetical protein